MYITLFLLLLLTASAHATDYYAESSGSDANDCTINNKCKSFSRLVDRTHVAGDNLHLKCGEIYRETVSSIDANTSGTSGSKITLKAYGSCYQRFGAHTGVNNSANLVETGTNFVTVGVQAGHRLFNRTKGAMCYISSITTTNTVNDTLVCSMGLSSTIPEDWDTGERYEVENKPVVTHASLFNSGWTEEATNVWTHAFTLHPGRHVWINGRSNNQDLHTGTCSVSGMASASDTQWCTKCTTGTADECGPGKVYIKSTSNPATRWTNPGVEVVHLFGSQTTLFTMGSVSHWIVKDITIEKVYGTPVTTIGSNITLDNVTLGYSQRKNCFPKDCTQAEWNGNTYSWLAGQDDRGGQLLGIGTSSPTSGLVINRLHGYQCENNCITASGLSSVTASITNSQITGNSHSTINYGLSSGVSGSRDITIDRTILHSSTVVLHSSGTGPTATFDMTNSLIYDIEKLGDLRHFGSAGRSDPFGIFHEDPGTYTYTNNIIIGGGHGVEITQGTHVFNNNIIRGNADSGINVKNTSPEIRLFNNIIADNCPGAVTSNCFQVGCKYSTCSSAVFNNASNSNNKFHQSTGSAFAAFNGGDESVTLSEWQDITGGDTDSVITDDCFVDPAKFDFNLATGCDDIGQNRGPFRQLTFSTASLASNVLTLTWSIGGVSPLSLCKPANITVTYNGVPATISQCTVSGSTATVTLAVTPIGGTVVAVSGLYGAVEDSTLIGNILNARSRPFGPVNFTVAGGGGGGSGSPDCTYYASPVGTGTACTLEAPCTVSQAIATVNCDETVCLLDGVYQGVSQIINLDNKACTDTTPLIIRALNWGKARLDGQTVRTPVTLGVNTAYITLSGFDASNGQTEVFLIKGRNNTLTELIGYNAGLTSSSLVFDSNGTMAVTTETNLPNTSATTARSNTFDTLAGFGKASRVIRAYQTEGMRIANSFGQWMCTQDTGQKSVLEVEDSRSVVVEDNIVTWNEITANCTPANSSQKGRFIGNHRENRWGDGANETCLDNNFYGNAVMLKQSDVGPASFMFRSDAERCSHHEHNLVWIEPGVNFTSTELFSLGPASDGATSGSLVITCNTGTGPTDCNYHAVNNTAVHNGNTPSYDADWIQSNNISDVTPMDIATSPWLSTTGANLCLKFINGVRTAIPRWPWEMNQRLINAMQSAGYTPYDVHTELQTALGIIPQRCLRGSHEQVW